MTGRQEFPVYDPKAKITVLDAHPFGYEHTTPEHRKLNATELAACKQARVKTSLDMVRVMVKRGLTFFSSVVVSTEDEGMTYHVPTSYAAVDTMLFNLEGRALIVALRLCQNFHPSNSEAVDVHKMHVEAIIFAQRADDEVSIEEYKRQYDHAMREGWFYVQRNQYGWSEDHDYKIPAFPSMSSGCANAHRKYMPDWSYNGGLIGNTHHAGASQYTTWPINSCNIDTVPVRIHQLCDLLDALRPVISTANNGRINEFSSHAAVPSYVFHGCESLFWEQFNSRHLRPLVKRAI